MRHGALAGLLAVGVVASAGLFSEVAGLNPHPHVSEPESLFGNYLAGRQARFDRDTHTAAIYYSKALEKDPENEVILEQTFLLEAAAANWARAVPLAEKLVKTDKSHLVARLVLGIAAFKDGNYEEADKQFSAAHKSSIADLTTKLARAWSSFAAGKPDAAFSLLNNMKKAEWALFYRRYHKGLIADLAGRHNLARDSFARAFEKNKRTLRIAEAYARHMAQRGDFAAAQKILKDHVASASPHPLSSALLVQLEKGEKPGFLVTSAAEGLAEVFYGIGDALTGEGNAGIETGTIYLQLAFHLRPDFPLALQSLGEVYDAAKRYEPAIQAYDRVRRSSSLWLTVQIRKAYDLNSLERVDESVALLRRLADEMPDEARPLDALGSILRSHKRYEEAAAVYTRAIALVEKPAKQHWSLYYARGVCHERMKQWPKAEADLKRALELHPDQPLALNYLGYSWVDQGQHLQEGLKLIRKAVELKPNDGYFVDSLGWAEYRLGNYKEAAKHLERAAELRPDDPVINDHLGDAYWRVGRKLEAEYQWSQALTLNPEPEDEKLIRRKLSEGLDAVLQKKAAASEPPTGKAKGN